MTNATVAFAVAGLALFALGLMSKSPAPPPNRVKVESDIVYGTGPVGRPAGGRKTLLMDVYQPVGGAPPEPLPAILLIHGGGFSRGDKDGTIAVLARRLAEQGLVAATINYRLIPDHPPGLDSDPLRRALEAARQDAGMALAWLRENAARYRIDRDRVAIGGSSAGAITALFLAYSKPPPKTPVRAVVDLWGGLYGQENLIASGDPPLLIVHGSRDNTVPFRGAAALKARCDQVGLDCEYWPADGAGHGFAAIPPDYDLGGETLARRVALFLHSRMPRPF